MNTRAAYLWIASGLIVWSAVLAFGAYRFNHNVWRGLIVFGATAAFLGFWAAMAANRQRRLRRQPAPEEGGAESRS